MAGLSDKEYYDFVDEALVLYGGGAPCASIDNRLWYRFKDKFKKINACTPKVVDWSYDQVCDWMKEYDKIP